MGFKRAFQGTGFRIPDFYEVIIAARSDSLAIRTPGDAQNGRFMAIQRPNETAALPILAITAFGQTTMRAALAAGASACVRKPVVMAEFLPMIKDLIA